MFNAVSNILTQASSNCVMMINCPENSSILIEGEDDVVQTEMIVAPEVATSTSSIVAPKKKQAAELFPTPPHHFQEIELSKRIRIEEKGEEEKGEEEKDAEYGNDHENGITERRHHAEGYENEVPAPLSSDSIASSSSSSPFSSSEEDQYIESTRCSSSSEEALHAKSSDCSTSTCASKEDNTNDTIEGKKEQKGDDITAIGRKGLNKVGELETDEVTKKKQMVSTNTYTIYYNIEETDQNDDIVPAVVERREVKADLKREIERPKTKKDANTTRTAETQQRTTSLWKRRPINITTKAGTMKAMAEAVRQMKKTYIQNKKTKELSNIDRLYEHGKQSVSTRRQLARARHEEMNKSAQFERKFQEKRKGTARSTAGNQKHRTLSLYDLSKSKQMEGRMRRIEIMNMTRRKAELRSRNICSSRSTPREKRFSCYYSISPSSTATTSSQTTKISSSSSSQEEKRTSLSDEESANKSLTKLSPTKKSNYKHNSVNCTLHVF